MPVAGLLSEMWSYVTPALLTLFDARLTLFIGTNLGVWSWGNQQKRCRMLNFSRNKDPNWSELPIDNSSAQIITKRALQL